jgi:hypothetical protein
MEYDPKSNIFRALVHMVHAHDHAKAGLIHNASQHRQKAQDHFSDHVKELTQQNKHDEVNSLTDQMKSYFDKIDQMIGSAQKNKKKKFFKSENKDLEKAITVSVPGTPAKRYKTKEAVDRQPGKDSRYDYKPFHQLSHEDQVSATHAFQGRDMTNHHYPVDRKTGKFENGATRWLQSSKAPTATPEDQGSVVAPEHRNGASVRINAEGHPLHGKLGMVKLPNPNMKGKIAVQVGPKDHEMEYLEPHQVKLNQPEKSKDMSDLISRSKVVLKSIREDNE